MRTFKTQKQLHYKRIPHIWFLFVKTAQIVDTKIEMTDTPYDRL